MTEITEAVELAKEIVWDLDVRHELIPNQALAQRHAKVLATLLSELTRLQEENGQLRLAICGGEDAPGYADSLPLADILGVAANNLSSWREASDRAARLQEEVEDLQRTFDLQWAADMRATKRWRDAGEGRDLTLPDRADLVVFLLEKLEDAEAVRAGGPLTSEQVREFAIRHHHLAIPVRPGITVTWTDEETGEVTRATLKGRNVVPLAPKSTLQGQQS